MHGNNGITNTYIICVYIYSGPIVLLVKSYTMWGRHTLSCLFTWLRIGCMVDISILRLAFEPTYILGLVKYLIEYLITFQKLVVF